MTKKVALLLVGHVRNFDALANHYKEIFLFDDKKVEVDVFAHTYLNLDWDRDYRKNKTTISEKYEKINLDKEYFSTLPIMVKDMVFEEEYQNKDKTLNQWGKVSNAYKFISSYDEYDYVIRARFDLWFFQKFPYEIINDESVDVFIPEEVWKSGISNLNHHINDFIIVSNKKATKVLENFGSFVQQNQGIYSEKVLAMFLRNSGLKCQNYKLDFNLERRTNGYETWCVGANADTERRKNGQ